VMKTMIGLEGMVLSLDFSCCSLAAKESWYLLIPKKYKQSKGPPEKKKMYGFTGLLKQFKLTFLLPNIAMEVPLLYIDSCL
jgi:hypothetical protein